MIDIIELKKRCIEENIILKCNNQINIRWRFVIKKKFTTEEQETFIYFLNNLFEGYITRFRWHLLHETLEIPKCPYCKKEMHWNARHSRYYCSDKKCGVLKTKEEYKAKTGYDNSSLNPDVLTKRKNTRDKHRLENPNFEQEAYTKRIKTCLKKYGETHVMHVKEFSEKTHARVRYIYNKINFDSSWELAFYKYCLDTQKEIIREPENPKLYYKDKKGKNHRYYPDFLVDGKLVEISSEYSWKTKSKEKKELIEKQNVQVILTCDKYLNYCKGIEFKIEKYKC